MRPGYCWPELPLDSLPEIDRVRLNVLYAENAVGKLIRPGLAKVAKHL